MKKHTVAIVDDCPITRMTTQATLTRFGWIATAFDNTIGLTVKLKNMDPDIILLDVNMPILNGEAIMKSLKGVHGPKNAKLLFHSDRSEEELKQLTSKAQADGFIKKTSDGKSLHAKLKSFL